MNTTRSSALVLALGACAAAPAAQAAPPPLAHGGKHLLRYAYQEGAAGYYTILQGGDIAMNAGAEPIEMSSRIKMFMKFRVVDVAEGRATVEHTCERVTIDIDNPMTGSMQLDSDDEDADALISLRDIVGEPLAVKLDARGRPSESKLALSAQQGTALAGVKLEKAVAFLAVELPEQPIAVGETWRTTFSLPLAGVSEADIEIVNRLLGVAGSRITVEQDIALASGEAAGDDLKADFRTAKATMVIDLNDGLPVSMHVQLDLSMTAPMPMDMKMSMTLVRTPGPAAAPAAPEKQPRGQAGPVEGGSQGGSGSAASSDGRRGASGGK